jgi:asparagine synthase (glutamine-hydrolysing)
MCGILAVLGVANPSELRAHIIDLSSRLRHRGPDWSGVTVHGNNIFAHERLSIIGLFSGEQPMLSNDGDIIVTVNGEIYNYKELMATALNGTNRYDTGSDCEVLLYLYKEYGANFLPLLQGDFAFVLGSHTSYLAARDPIGVAPLYWGKSDDGKMWFASEMKALVDDCVTINIFPPGYYYTPETGFRRYYEPKWFYEEFIPNEKADLSLIKSTFEKAVERRMMAEVPYGVLLSGGLDSSLVAAVTKRKMIEQGSTTPLISISIGLKGQSPDLVAARKVADFLGTKHYEFTFTVQDGLDALKKLIYHLESYDVTTIRASTPMFLLSRKVKALGIKMVLSGEGSDEELGGYLYFAEAPNKELFHQECVRRVKNLHTSDCLRANKSTAAWGVEVRVPFLDKDFVDLVMMIDPAEKMFGKDKIEKYIMRKAFDSEEDPYLPKEILWRQKEQFSDGVGYGWIDTLISTASQKITDEMFEMRAEIFPIDTPKTKEAYYYRQIFEGHFHHPYARKTVQAWVPTWGSKDPSGRAQKIHAQHDETKKVD